MSAPTATQQPEMNELIEQAKARQPITPAELQVQRISFAFGNLPNGSKAFRFDVAEMDYAKYGNLAAIEARISAAEAMADALRKLTAWNDQCRLSGDWGNWDWKPDDEYSVAVSSLAKWDSAK